ncbi:hypothetical protein T190130A13A_10006 [Tenacibaculum sp. 190130A14a]|uniref:Uncharacterized protein n=1 Tax=Tenacibaculum polynesiense TaxID=3137857 RepID=A0ABM9P9W3_9FLAO
MERNTCLHSFINYIVDDFGKWRKVSWKGLFINRIFNISHCNNNIWSMDIDKYFG